MEFNLNRILSPPDTADVVIIGAGIVGAAVAFHAMEAGMNPILVERRTAPASLTTPKATGAFRLQFDNREEIELISESVNFYVGFHDAFGIDIGVYQQGYLWCGFDEEICERQLRQVELQRGWGLEDVELLSGDETRSRFPFVGPDVLQARFRAGDGFVDPPRLALALLQLSDAHVLLETEVINIEVSDGSVQGLLTSRGPIMTSNIVVAGGPFSQQLCRLAGVELPLEPMNRHKLIIREAPFVPADAPMTIDEHTGSHWRPAFGGAYLLHTDDFTPTSEPELEPQGDPDFYQRLLNPSSPFSVHRISPFWERAWDNPNLSWEVIAGQYTMTPDHRPLIGQTEVGGLYINAGYSGHGIMGSFACSRMLVDLMCGQVPVDGNPLAPEREFVEREMVGI